MLASQSPRRKALLQDLELPFEVFTREVDETLPPEVPGPDAAAYLARHKAASYDDHAQNRIVITADTIVLLGEKILAKPADSAEARAMLLELSGKTHLVISGVCFRWKDHYHTFAETTRVTFRPLSDQTIDHYIEVYKPYDKAGSYGIQEWIGMVGIERIEGDYYNVVGLPVSRLYLELEKFRQMISSK